MAVMAAVPMAVSVAAVLVVAIPVVAAALVRVAATPAAIASAAATTTAVATRWAVLEILVLLPDVGQQVLAKLLGLLDHPRIRSTANMSVEIKNDQARLFSYAT